MKLQDVLKNKQQSSMITIPEAIHFAVIAYAYDRELATQIQIRLIDLALLEPPADRKFSPVSTAGLKRFQILMQCDA